MAGSTRGRKPRLDAKMEERLLALLRAGVPKEVACAGVGISSRTLRIWMERARSGEKRYQDFATNAEQASAEAQSSILVKIRQAGNKDWRALAWFMERVFSERYGYKAQVQVSVEQQLERFLDVAETTLGAENAAKLFAAIAGEPSEEAASETSGTAAQIH